LQAKPPCATVTAGRGLAVACEPPSPYLASSALLRSIRARYSGHVIAAGLALDTPRPYFSFRAWLRSISARYSALLIPDGLAEPACAEPARTSSVPITATTTAIRRIGVERFTSASFALRPLPAAAFAQLTARG